MLRIRTSGWHKSGMHRAERAKRRSCGVSMTRCGMTKMVMMWLFGVPVSVLLLFMIFGVF